MPPTQVDYFNNATIVELVERPHRGVLAVLDEACSAAGTITDRIFLQSLDTHHRHHPHYTSRQVLPCPGPCPQPGTRAGPRPAPPAQAQCCPPWRGPASSPALSAAQTPALCLDPGLPPPIPQLCPTDKTMEFGRDFRIKHYAGDVT